MSEPERPELRDLVVECLERMEEDGSGVVDEICREHPEHAAALRRRISALHGIGLMGAEGFAVQPGQRLGDFQILEQLGEGGMGVVYLARQVSLDREVALKLIRPDHLHSELARGRFQREVELAAALQHPGIVPVYSVAEEQGLPFFVMERVRGATLAEVLEELEGQAPEALTGAELGEALTRCLRAADLDIPVSGGFAGSYVECCVGLVQQAALALGHAHGRAVLHRDVKPSNLMLTPEGRVLLMDFGLASTAGVSRLTGTGHLIGSLQYMAPEQHRGEEADERTDVFGLGVTLYELLTLAPPFTGDTAAHVAAAILTGDPDRPREHNANVAFDVETVCLTAMERDPARRYRSVADLARDLGHLLAHEPIEARRLGPGLRLQRWSQRHPALTLSFFVALILTAAGLGTIVLQARQSNRELGESNDALALALDKAFGAVDRMLARFGGQLRDVPQAQSLRAEVMDDALKLFEEVAELGPIDDFRRKQWAELHNFKADALLIIGNHAGAVRSFEQGIALLEQLSFESPGVDIYLTLGAAHYYLAKVHVEDGANSDALAQYEAANQAYEAVLALEPGNAAALESRESARTAAAVVGAGPGKIEPLVQQGRVRLASAEAAATERPSDTAAALEQAMARYYLADGLYLFHGHEEAFDLYEQSLADFQRVLPMGDSVPEIPFRFAECSENYGLALALDGFYAKALTILEDGLAVAEPLISNYPDNDEYRFRFGRLWHSVGETYLMSGQPDQALPNLEFAVAEHERLVERTPDSSRRRNRLSEGLMNLGASLGWLGDPEGARQTLEAAIEQQQMVVTAEPENPEYARVMGTAHLELGLALRELGELEGCRKALDQVLTWCSDDPWTMGQLFHCLRRRNLVPEGFGGAEDRAGFESMVELLTASD